MRFNIVGAGPAGLYLAYLLKRSNPSREIRIFEQNAPDVTYGFGVVLSRRALHFIADGDQALLDRIGSHLQSWKDQHIVHQGVHMVVDGSSYSAIERLRLLHALQSLCADVGIDMRFESRIAATQECADGDVLVGADGANSSVRASHARAFGERAVDLQNYFAWYGVAHPYSAHTLTFREAAGGVFCGHHYRYTAASSTFVAEVDAETWHRSGMATMDDEQRQRFVERVFSDTLARKPLIANRSVWKRWRFVATDQWYVDDTVLIGDALRSAHPSIGSGTRLAMEDAIALCRAFNLEGDRVGPALARYVRERQPVRDKLNRAAELSISWYEAMAGKMRLPPYAFAYDYLMRTKIITATRLAEESPDFMARYRAVCQDGSKAAVSRA
jgi:2-polyprenyl-6-methoxyphenol hydroxylase-like FAD-dependent oxidoreductase